MTKKRIRRNAHFKRLHEILICLFLIAATLSVYWQANKFDFVNFDDNDYVTDNLHVQAGLTPKNIIWALTTTHASNWHPLTWLSHMLDFQLYGMNPGQHHMTNVLFHILNTLLLFFVFRKMTDNVWQSGFVAALFALHPLHVESVAWISERKDVLSAFFFMLTIWSYTLWAKQSLRSGYFLALLFFVLSLMSKPMVVTLPFVLLLLDFWPLNRLDLKWPKNYSNCPQKKSVYHLLWEKFPFFVFSTVSCFVTFFAQKKGGAVKSFEVYPLMVRLSNALHSYLKYIIKLLLPHKMAVLYQHPGILPLWETVGTLLILLSISLFSIIGIQRRPYCTVGWFWFLGTLIPVIGIIQIGSQAMADRYMYIPSIGIFIIMAWGVPGIVSNLSFKNIFLSLFATVFLLILGLFTWKQLHYWKNSIMLFERAIAVAPYNAVPHNNLGNALKEIGRVGDAVKHYRKAIRFKPDYYEAHSNLAGALEKTGRIDEAISHYMEALRIKPEFEQGHYNLANLLNNIGRTDEAIKHYFEALRIEPNFEKAHNNLGVALVNRGDVAAAEFHFKEALRINPNYTLAKNNLQNLLNLHE